MFWGYIDVNATDFRDLRLMTSDNGSPANTGKLISSSILKYPTFIYRSSSMTGAFSWEKPFTKLMWPGLRVANTSMSHLLLGPRLALVCKHFLSSPNLAIMAVFTWLINTGFVGGLGHGRGLSSEYRGQNVSSFHMATITFFVSLHC